MTQQAARRALGQRLRELRKAASLRAVDLAELMGISQSQISKMENGKRRVSPEQARVWAVHTGGDADQLAQEAVDADTDLTSWQVRFADGWARDQRTYVELERAALSVRAYQVSMVHGLLQTPAYTEFMLREMIGLADDQVAAGVSARMTRQRLLYEPSTRFSVILAEHVLRHRFAGLAVMIEQLHRIAQVAELPSVDLAVIPVDTAMPLPYMTSFNLYEMADDEMILLVELDIGEVRDTSPDRVEMMADRHAALRAAALTGQAAVDLVRHIATEATASLFKDA